MPEQREKTACSWTLIPLTANRRQKADRIQYTVSFARDQSWRKRNQRASGTPFFGMILCPAMTFTLTLTLTLASNDFDGISFNRCSCPRPTDRAVESPRVRPRAFRLHPHGEDRNYSRSLPSHCVPSRPVPTHHVFLCQIGSSKEVKRSSAMPGLASDVRHTLWWLTPSR